MKYVMILLAVLTLAGCAQRAIIQEAPPEPKQIDVYFDKLPTVEYTEVSKVFVNFREYGVFTRRITPEVMIEKLKDKAREIDADAITNIEIDNEPIAREQNKFWKASATAIKYN